MISRELNERLTRIGAGTPCGEMMRRYWQPLCPAAEITAEKPKKRVRILGENLLVFRDKEGRLGCIEENCKHRGTSLYYGYLEAAGLRCPYHGWLYDTSGQCLEQPLEPRATRNIQEMRLKSYRVQSLGGLLFVYMGREQDKAPLLPRWDVLVREDGKREVRVFPDHHCNWLQIQENTADSTHTYYLHGMMDKELGLNHPFAAYYRRPIESMDFSFCEWGLDKTIVYGGDVPETEIRPPMIFPNILRIPNGPVEVMHWRVPIDDENTRILFVAFTPVKNGSVRTPEDAVIPYEYVPVMKTPDGEYDLLSFFSQDQMAQETQGVIYDRSNENLGTSDRGIVMYRRMLQEQIDLVEQGRDTTLATVRDPEKNRMIDFPNITNPADAIELIRAREKAA